MQLAEPLEQRRGGHTGTLSSMLDKPLMFRKKVFKLLGKEVKVLDEQENTVLFVKQKAFKLREDIRVFGDETQTKEMLHIQARQILDFKAAYDVIDSSTGEKVGALRRKGWSSIIRDQWEVLDKNDQVIGKITEDQTVFAVLRRFSDLFSLIVPQSYSISCGDTECASLTQRRNPFIFKADFNVKNSAAIDPRLAVAGAVLLMTIEGRQN